MTEQDAEDLEFIVDRSNTDVNKSEIRFNYHLIILMVLS